MPRKPAPSPRLIIIDYTRTSLRGEQAATPKQATPTPPEDSAPR